MRRHRPIGCCEKMPYEKSKFNLKCGKYGIWRKGSGKGKTQKTTTTKTKRWQTMMELYDDGLRKGSLRNEKKKQA